MATRKRTTPADAAIAADGLRRLLAAIEGDELAATAEQAAGLRGAVVALDTIAGRPFDPS